MKFNTLECAKQIEFYYSLGRSNIAAVRSFNTWRLANNIPCPLATVNDVRRVVKKFSEKGTVNRNNKKKQWETSNCFY